MYRTVMAILLVGFDSAWTASKCGALVGALREEDGSLRGLGLPQMADYAAARCCIFNWQSEHQPSQSIVMLDQPTIVLNAAGQRPVESIVSSPVGRRYGGVQPANTSNAKMFGLHAPIWQFLEAFGGPANPFAPIGDTLVYETYPVLSLITLDWMLKDTRPAGRLPKYNPGRRKTFLVDDWKHVCKLVGTQMAMHNLDNFAAWAEQLGNNETPKKVDQDCLDACICLLTAIHLATNQRCLVVGNYQTGYILVPDCGTLSGELRTRCDETDKLPSEWVRTVSRVPEPN